ncbi:threonine synthase [Sphingorhabdus lutea]|uniref:Threonine synthase n=1 Tax=Sphingorhabdus lutea TaxID=1913578 RepID=A0A1L3J9X0_9SPHN|nr:threonine synthase [Sphingorhabdus lutea]APG61911.1 threonine synthase [Sphingorhabdus lutea]
MQNHPSYISTRGDAPSLNFADTTMTGLARDGGLYVPESWPQFSTEELREMRSLSYVELAVRVMSPFTASSLDEDELRILCTAAYGRFSHDAVTPLVQLDGQNWLMELFHGPTLAFKDVALQLLGELFGHFLQKNPKKLTIVGATSGDTGSAAIDGVAGRDNVEIFMLHPHGRISEVQRRQMTTILAPNVHNIAIEGSFDDAQAMVKRIFNDGDVTGTLNISAVNSINWARLLAQIVYYFYAALRLGGPDRKVAFSVPTGNFGDVFAGYAAAQMGLPIERLIVATNINDILYRALKNGDYSTSTVTPTDAPSMDIQVSSNFERLLFDLEGRDGATTSARMKWFEKMNKMVLSSDMRSKAALFQPARTDANEMQSTMLWAYEHYGQIIDPHTAIALHAARHSGIESGVPLVTLATAHPAKFRDAVEKSTGIRPSLPKRIGNLFDREERLTILPNEYEAVRDFILKTADQG